MPLGGDIRRVNDVMTTVERKIAASDLIWHRLRYSERVNTSGYPKIKLKCKIHQFTNPSVDEKKMDQLFKVANNTVYFS